MQLLEYLCREKAGTCTHDATELWHHRLPVIRGMNKTVEKYVNLHQLTIGPNSFSSIKKAGKDLMVKDPSIWSQRPLSEGLKVYGALDIVMIWAISDGLQKYERLQGVTRERIEIASGRYAGVRRDVGKRIDELFLRTSILLSHIIPVVDHRGRIIPFPIGDRTCTGCQRLMPGQDFHNNLCIDCNEIKRVSRHRN